MQGSRKKPGVACVVLIELLYMERISGEEEDPSASSLLPGLQHCQSLNPRRTNSLLKCLKYVWSMTDTCEAILRGYILLDKIHNTIIFKNSNNTLCHIEEGGEKHDSPSILGKSL